MQLITELQQNLTMEMMICNADVAVLGTILHQFPPVAQPASEYLYRPVNMVSDSLDSQIGQMIYEEFRTVVILKEQM